MKTDEDRKNAAKKNLEEAKRRLQSGEAIGLPTETVYGLAADIYNQEAVKSIFALKERPLFDPLIVHVADVEMAKKLTTDWSDLAQSLAEAFWPGPLTLVLPKKSEVSDLITAGLSTVGLRCPNHLLALELLKTYAQPLCAPSANKFTRTSPTSAEHVKQEFSNVFVLDGGSCDIGIESTILEIRRDKSSEKNKYQLKILRPGMIFAEQISNQLRAFDFSFIEKKDEASPGNFAEHYRPKSALICIDARNLRHHSTSAERHGHLLSLLRGKMKVSGNHFHELILPKEAHLAARVLYSALRENQNTDLPNCLVVEDHMRSPQWEAIMDRLNKAASYHI